MTNASPLDGRRPGAILSRLLVVMFDLAQGSEDSQTVSLGLDLQGGAHLLRAVDRDDLAQARLQELRETLVAASWGRTGRSMSSRGATDHCARIFASCTADVTPSISRVFAMSPT